LNYRSRDGLPCEWAEIGHQERQEQRGTLRCGGHQFPSDDSFGLRNFSNGDNRQNDLKSGWLRSRNPSTTPIGLDSTGPADCRPHPETQRP